MRVKRLEIQGFKSFKDKTVIHFDHSITGIVGPNGCGKSNIVDAFFWVMGEQSYKHIRGSGSDDLIFNGSAKFNPLGMAEATLVLETDYVDTRTAPAGASVQDLPNPLKSKEISVTRRVYRGGEGEYFINGLPARLKDIQELFLDTGVGAKGYSVIEQGQIGKIVNAKPEDRRRLVEDAAGIAKYKARKKESLRKLESAQSNLNRLSDIIQEIERNLKSLERQAQRAKKYKEYRDELFAKEITWGRRKERIFQNQLEELRQEKERLQHEIAGLRAELESSEAGAETDRVIQLTDSKKAEELQSEIQKLSRDLAQEESSLELSRQRQQDLARQIQSMNHERGELLETLGRDRNAVQVRVEEFNRMGEETQRVLGRVKEVETEVQEFRAELEGVQRTLDESKNELMDSIQLSSELAARSSALAARDESDRATLKRINERKNECEEKTGRIISTSEELTAKLSAVCIRQSEVNTAFEEKKNQATELEARIEELVEKRVKSHEELTQAKSRLESLEALEKAREGLSEGPKSVLEWAEAQGKGDAFKIIADLLKVKAGYEAAVEGWFENELSDLVSMDPQSCAEALEVLENEKKGRATIHFKKPAHAIEAPARNWETVQALVANAGLEVLGQLKDFVEIESDSPFVRSVEERLSNICLVREMPSFTGLFERDRLAALGEWSIVSLSGRVFSASGSIRGGLTESGEDVRLLSRKRAMEELAQKVSLTQDVLKGLDEEKQKAEELALALQEEIEKLGSELRDLEIKRATQENETQQMRRTRSEVEAELSQLQSEKTALQEQMERSKTEREGLEEKMAKLHARRSELESRLNQDDSDLKSRSQILRQKEADLQKARIEEASHHERLSSLTRELESSRAYLTERENRLRELESLIEKTGEQQEQQTGGDSGIQGRIEELTRTIAARQELLSEVKNQLASVQANLDQALDRSKKLHKELEAKTARSSEVAVEIERVSAELSHLVQNLEEKYGQGCLRKIHARAPEQEEMPDPVVTAEISEEEEVLLFEEVERLRDRIRRLGDVNPMALEEFEELNQRYEYLCGERTDLQQSIENLNEAIEHINETSKDRFKKAFEAIAERFKRLFPIIFGGGRAELTLVYPEGSDDILDAGIEILAQPPGKKIVNIGLLSGGEKALTAISLIFAIFMVKPSPFCILDEVDAPLDDANIGKFNALLKEMAEKTQFILITHNKKTMELNDTLYGVTMEDPGVSKMVSIEMS